MSKKKSRILVVGAGMAGLTASAYLARAGYDVLLIEKNKKCGGLLSSFKREGFVFDAGPRSILNAGIIRPMLDELGIELELLDSRVSIGIEDDIIHYTRQDGLQEYTRLLEKLYPDSTNDIETIIAKIKGIVKDMAVLYGIDNPFFKDLKDMGYLFKEVFPWLGKFMLALYRMGRKTEPVEEFLERYTSNQALVDIIAQHFFQNTPVFFALGYFYVYTDYMYPRGGTGELPGALVQKILESGGTIQRETKITGVIPSEKKIIDAKGTTYPYDYLVWCADLKTLYRILRVDGLGKKASRKIAEQGDLFLSKRGNDSIFSLFVAVDEPLETFGAISNGHFFYTPTRAGLGDVHRAKVDDLVANFESKSKEDVLSWLDEYCRLSTYEISVPALRDPSLTPEGKTGIVINLFLEYELMKKIEVAGWAGEFQAGMEHRMLETLSDTVYPGLKDKILFRFSASPLKIEQVAGTSEGAIVGWSYTSEVPVVSSLQKISASVKTPIPRVLQAGQWAYSPAGIPTAILTGFFAAKRLKKIAK